MTGVRNISSAGRIEMNVIETPASVPSSAARGVTRRTNGPRKPPRMRTRLCSATQVSPASHALIGSPVCSLIGSITANTTMNMCPTPGPDGNAQTSRRPVRRARLYASQA